LLPTSPPENRFRHGSLGLLSDLSASLWPRIGSQETTLTEKQRHALIDFEQLGLPITSCFTFISFADTWSATMWPGLFAIPHLAIRDEPFDLRAKRKEGIAAGSHFKKRDDLSGVQNPVSLKTPNPIIIMIVPLVVIRSSDGLIVLDGQNLTYRPRVDLENRINPRKSRGRPVNDPVSGVND